MIIFIEEPERGLAERAITLNEKPAIINSSETHSYWNDIKYLCTM